MSLADVTEGLANYLHTQSSLVQPENISIHGPQQHSTPSASPYITSNPVGASPYQQHDSPFIPQEGEDPEDMPVRGLLSGMPLPTGNRERNNNKRGQPKTGLNNFSSNLFNNNATFSSLHGYDSNTSSNLSMLIDSEKSKGNGTLYSEKKEVFADKSEQKQNKPPVLSKPTPVKTDVGKKHDNDSGMVDDSNLTTDVDISLSSKIDSILNSEKSFKSSETRGDKQSVSNLSSDVKLGSKVKSEVPVAKPRSIDTEVKSSADVQRTESEESNPAEPRPRRSKKKQGLTINEALDSLDRELTEEEIWALCREGALALQRKKRHLRKLTFIKTVSNPDEE